MQIIKIVLPVILVSLVAIFAIIVTKKKSKSHDQKENHIEDNYMYEGMSIGMCLGTVIGISPAKNI